MGKKQINGLMRCLGILGLLFAIIAAGVFFYFEPLQLFFLGVAFGFYLSFSYGMLYLNDAK